MTQTLALGIAYSGESFSGWQVQPDRPSVQAEIESALEKFLCTRTPTFCAGRTDAGVHACHQVVSFTTPVQRPTANYVRALNTFLPSTVSVRWAATAPDNFHARFDARSRTYQYWIYNHPVRNPLFDTRTGWVFRPLDVERMRLGAQHLIGTHDFTSFRCIDCQAASPIRTLTDLRIIRQGDLVGLTITANAFLQHMVRNIVGTLIYVGTGRESPDWVERVLAAKNRALAAPTFSPNGLYLTGVYYPELTLPMASPGPFGEVFN